VTHCGDCMPSLRREVTHQGGLEYVGYLSLPLRNTSNVDVRLRGAEDGF